MGLGEKIAGALYGLSIGDAMGGPVEKWPAEKVARTFSDVHSFLPVTHGGDESMGKGNGRFTDDTLMTEALVRAYNRCQNHMDSYDFEEFMLPEMAQTKVWVPERQAFMTILERLYWPEKYPWIRLVINNAEPRNAGVGNRVNCGVAMYIMPVGAVNAADSAAAYQEAASLAIAHNESFAVEAAAVLAAAGATAFTNGATIDAVVENAFSVARDGTKKAIEAVLEAVNVNLTLTDFIEHVRSAVAPFDQRPTYLPDDQSFSCIGIRADVGRPSRESCIEELPVALAALKYGDGDFYKTIEASVFYGRDCDSIAGMSCSLYGAIYGVDAIPLSLRKGVDAANRRDFSAVAATFTRTVENIYEKDNVRFEERRRLFL